MAKQANELIELLRTILIAQLGLAGVSQPKIRMIAKCDMNRVNSIVKHLKSAKNHKKANEK